MIKKLKPLTIFLSDDELVNFKSHFDEFLNMNCDDKIKKQQEEIEKLKLELLGYRQAILQDKEMLGLKQENERLHSIIKEVREYIKDRYDGEVLTHTFDKDNVGELLNILKGVDKE